MNSQIRSPESKIISMTKRKGKIYIGTSGWHYKHWTGNFYPDTIKGSRQFDEYKKNFETVEINNSFYKLPSDKTFRQWALAAQKGFTYAIKASRFITHVKKLAVDMDSISLLLSRVDKLKEKLGPILFQLPPGWMVDVERFRKFLEKIPYGYRYTFEFRNTSWYKKEIYELLKQHHCAFCIYELAGHTSPKEITADFVYIRLHGPGNKYQGSYTDETLKNWAKLCMQWRNSGLDVYVYFDNDQNGYAAFYALTLKQMVDG